MKSVAYGDGPNAKEALVALAALKARILEHLPGKSLEKGPADGPGECDELVTATTHKNLLER